MSTNLAALASPRPTRLAETLSEIGSSRPSALRLIHRHAIGIDIVATLMSTNAVRPPSGWVVARCRKAHDRVPR